MYSANSIDDGIHTVDMASIDTTKIAGNTYDIVIRVTDIDVSANKPHSIVAQYLSDTVTIENVEIPEQRVKTNVTASSTVGTQRQDATSSQSVNTSSSTTESIEVEETSTENDTN